MDSMKFCNSKCYLLSPLLILLLFSIPTECESHKREFYLNETNNEINAAPVQLTVQPNQVMMYNGIVKVTISKPGGSVTGIQYNGINNLLHDINSGYWDCVWNSDTGHGSTDKFEGTDFKIISQTPDQVEVSFSKTWKKGSPFTLNMDKRYIMVWGKSGFYTYTILEHLKGMPWFNLEEFRVVFKLNDNQFRYIALSDQRQKIMPTGAERSRGKMLGYPEAVRLPNGEVDDKYQYTMENQDSHLYGWIADNPATGFWIIRASDEFRVGGPFRQDLTCHTAAIAISYFISSHYAHRNATIYLNNGEPWKKVFGPVFVYLNSDKTKDHRQALWKNAKYQMYTEMKSWPYSFASSVDYTKANSRGSLSGQLQVQDRYAFKSILPASFANVGLALPGGLASWETETKGYQFWTRADKQGNFVINNVRPGTYNLYAWVPGYHGDYRYKNSVIIREGGVVKLNGLVFNLPRYGPSLWHIGYPDRSASEFYIPDVNPYYKNSLYLNFDKFRQYGLWERYSELYPKNDLTFTIGSSNHSRDWFFAHVPRKTKNGRFVPTTWNINFQLKSVEKNKDYLLRIAFAAGHMGNLRIYANKSPLIFTIGEFGRDNAIARHGIHGLYHSVDIRIPSASLVVGNNTIHLYLQNYGYYLTGYMYDYIRLEGPPKL